MKMNKKRVRINVQGRVQGVGFRPTVYRYAKERNLSGWTANTSKGVQIEVEGDNEKIDDFINSLKLNPPPQAKITNLETYPLLPQNENKFKIRPSISQTEIKTQISPDIATCKECLGELFSFKNHRYFYPFLNCTNCGPRFTIVRDIPYDRNKTTMKKFMMCPSCLEEYENPLNRRFHTQPNACPKCGPEVQLVQGSVLRVQSKRVNAIKETIELLKQGKIIAIKGLGGFHLACDAFNEQAVKNLRNSKYREDKPFAMMAKDIQTIKQFCEVSPEEEKLLLSSRRPIVLLKKSENFRHGACLPSIGQESASGIAELQIKGAISKQVAPNSKYWGFMLPYTPLHHLLLNSQLSILVMTSGNISDEPIAYENKEALLRLKNIADYFLLHNRDIYIRCDDSVTRVFCSREMILRRSRGYVPQPIRIKNLESRTKNKISNSQLPILNFQFPILACGAHLKNTFCLAKDNDVFISHHIGDLENAETLSAYEAGIKHFEKIFNIHPEIIAHDLHPEYLSTKYAFNLQTLNPKIRTVAIQHHHAHIASCLADNKKDQKVIGVTFDGTGYGDDGNIWGGEFLIADFNEYRRIAHLKYVPMPGGEKVIIEPWRMAATFLYQTYGKDFINLDIDFLHRLDKKKWMILEKMIGQNINSLLSSSIGRLFDAVSSLVGIRDKINYEGQAAVELEMQIVQSLELRVENYRFEIKKEDQIYIIDPIPIIKGIVDDLQRNFPVSVISNKFHNTIAKMIVETCIKIRSDLKQNYELPTTNYKLNGVALSGGVFQNMVLLNLTYQLLKKEGFIIYTHSRIPPNDGGICLGQAVIANNKITKLDSV